VAQCPETIEELKELEKLLPLCRRTIYETAQAKIESGASYSQRNAARQIAAEKGRPVESIRQRIQEEKREISQKDNVVRGVPPCESGIQAAAPTCPPPHVARNTGENEWYTPPEFIEAARNVMGGIDCDPASTEIANRTVKAAKFYTADDDGRNKEWAAKVWMNPPYAQPLISEFSVALTTRLQSGQVKEACVLVNNATETNWFQLLMEKATAVAFIKGRVRFLDPEGNPGAPLQGQCLLYFGEKIKDFYQQFERFGIILTNAKF